MSDEREPGGDEIRPTDDEMHERDTTPEETEAGAAALRELGAATPLPADVLARLEGRLEAEPGLAAPVRPARRARRRRAAFFVPGFGVALAAVVAIAVIATQGSSPAPTVAPTAGAFEKSTAIVPQSSATAGTHANDSPLPARLRTPALVGRSYPEALALAQKHGLRLVPAQNPCTPPAKTKVTTQTPRAGAPVAAGAAIRVRTQRCGS
jgi:PASTA domain